MIETRGLTRHSKTRKQVVEAVKGVDLTVRKGEIFGFLGPNGDGKTTTLRMLARLLPPTGGEATVAGADLRKEPGTVRERIGYIGQRGGTDIGVSGRDELMLQCRLYGLSRQEARRRIDELIEHDQGRLPGDREAGLVALIGVMMASTSHAVALWLRSEDAYAPLVFTATLPLLLLNGVLLPLTLAPDWLRRIAAFNPLAYAVDAARAAFLLHLDDPSVTKGLVIITILAVIAVLGAARSFGRAVA